MTEKTRSVGTKTSLAMLLTLPVPPRPAVSQSSSTSSAAVGMSATTGAISVRGGGHRRHHAPLAVPQTGLEVPLAVEDETTVPALRSAGRSQGSAHADIRRCEHLVLDSVGKQSNPPGVVDQHPGQPHGQAV